MARKCAGWWTKSSDLIRTPLNAVLGFAVLIEQPETTGLERRMFVDTILRNGTEVCRVVDEILRSDPHAAQCGARLRGVDRAARDHRVGAQDVRRHDPAQWHGSVQVGGRNPPI